MADDQLKKEFKHIEDAVVEATMKAKTNRESDGKVLINLGSALHFMRIWKPEESGERARRYAVAITEMEKAVAYFKTYVVDD